MPVLPGPGEFGSSPPRPALGPGKEQTRDQAASGCRMPTRRLLYSDFGADIVGLPSLGAGVEGP